MLKKKITTTVLAEVAGITLCFIGCASGPAKYVQREAPTNCEPGTQAAIVDKDRWGMTTWSCLKKCGDGREYITEEVSDNHMQIQGYRPHCAEKCEPGFERREYVYRSGVVGRPDLAGECVPHDYNPR